MTKKSISVFLPTRKGSQRVKNKNTRKFSNFEGGLLELKLTQLLEVSMVEEIVLSTNDPLSIEIGQKIRQNHEKVRIVKRPDSLSSNNTDLIDLINYVPEICKSNHILWTHVTSPFVTASDYELAINYYYKALESGYDSLMSVKRFQNFLWSKKKNDIINRDSNDKWPKTQELQELYEIDSAFFITSRAIYINDSDRIGRKPELFIQDNFKSFDIDWEDDFELAQFIYNKKFL
ncbi:MAG: acylneuraminate cytidylyltransferase family protein [Ignavibacteriae bacterium]|nr:acylneuraminate cytidylyltransferase family protein [Ignavibacteriota bacterium]